MWAAVRENGDLFNCCKLHNFITVVNYRIFAELLVSYPLAFDAPVRGVPVGISAPPLGRKKEWCRYPMVKNLEDIFIRFDVIHERDRQTDTRSRTLDDSKDRACIASRGKNAYVSCTIIARWRKSKRCRTVGLR